MKILIALMLLAGTACAPDSRQAVAPPQILNATTVDLPEIPRMDTVSLKCVEFDYVSPSRPQCTHRLLWCGGYQGGLTKLYSPNSHCD